jgi:transcriptional regulator with XRE-family HTH domain
MKMTNHNENGNLDSIIDQMLDSVSPVDSKKVEDRLLLAARIADLIAERKMSKKQFAGLMDKEPSVISKWLGGTHNFTQDTLSEISFKLGITMVEFYREKPAPVVFRTSFDIVQATGDSIAHMGDSDEWLPTINAHAIYLRLPGHAITDHIEKPRRTRHPEENTVRKA